MLDLATISRIAQDSGLTVTNHIRDIECALIPGLDPTEPVTTYVIERHSDDYVTGIPLLQLLIVVRSNGDAWIVGMLESSRWTSNPLFALDHKDYEYWYNEVAPLYNLLNGPDYIRTPSRHVIDTDDSSQQHIDFYYHDRIRLPADNLQELSEGILTNAIGQMVYCITTYRSTMDAHFDVGREGWVRDHAEMRSINSNRLSVVEVRYGVVYVRDQALNAGFALAGWHAYVPLNSMFDPRDGLRSAFGPQHRMMNKKVIKPYSDFWTKYGLSTEVGILNERSGGHLDVIAKQFQRFCAIEINPEMFDIFYIEVASASSIKDLLLGVSVVLNSIVTQHWSQQQWYVHKYPTSPVLPAEALSVLRDILGPDLLQEPDVTYSAGVVTPTLPTPEPKKDIMVDDFYNASIKPS